MVNIECEGWCTIPSLPPCSTTMAYVVLQASASMTDAWYDAASTDMSKDPKSLLPRPVKPGTKSVTLEGVPDVLVLCIEPVVVCTPVSAEDPPELTPEFTPEREDAVLEPESDCAITPRANAAMGRVYESMF